MKALEPIQVILKNHRNYIKFTKIWRTKDTR